MQRLPWPRTAGIEEFRTHLGGLALRFINLQSQRTERKKWIHNFENITSIIFVVDLTDYNQIVLGQENTNRMLESLLLFESTVNSRWFMRTSIILFLNNVGTFKEQIARDPLQNYFPDYAGGNDVNRAAKYLLWRFNQVNRAHLNLYPHLVELSDPSSIRLVFTAVKEIILQNALMSE